MNFLAHLHLAHLAESSLSGNLLADFVRGNPEESFPPDVVAGIHMHRRIDVLTDNLPEVREAREWFRSETRRVAPITLDVMGITFFPATGRSCRRTFRYRNLSVMPASK